MWREHYDRRALRIGLGIEPDARVVGLLPGSRERETGMLLPIMLESARKLVEAHENDGVPIRFVLAQAASLPQSLIDNVLADSTVPVTVAHDKPFEVMAAADMLFVASGTATLQSAVIGTPMVIVYRASQLTALFARLVVNIQLDRPCKPSRRAHHRAGTAAIRLQQLAAGCRGGKSVRRRRRTCCRRGSRNRPAAKARPYGSGPIELQKRFWLNAAWGVPNEALRITPCRRRCRACA